MLITNLIFSHFGINIFFKENIPQKLLAWSSELNNKVSIVEFETRRKFATFAGMKLLRMSCIFVCYSGFDPNITYFV